MRKSETQPGKRLCPGVSVPDSVPVSLSQYFCPGVSIQVSLSRCLCPRCLWCRCLCPAVSVQVSLSRCLCPGVSVPVSLVPVSLSRCPCPGVTRCAPPLLTVTRSHSRSSCCSGNRLLVSVSSGNRLLVSVSSGNRLLVSVSSDERRSASFYPRGN